MTETKLLTQDRAPARATRMPATAALWVGRALSGLVVAFLLFDGVGKVVGERHVAPAMAELGWPPEQAFPLGVLLLVFTVLYAAPRTAPLGAILLTGFLGGATAAKARLESGWLVLSVVFAVLAWAGLWLRDARVRGLFTPAR